MYYATFSVKHFATSGMLPEMTLTFPPSGKSSVLTTQACVKVIMYTCTINLVS